MGLKLVTAPSTFPITLVEAKSHLRVDHSEDDDLIDAMISAATGYAEKFLGRRLVEQTWDLYLDAFPDAEGVNPDIIEIPYPPLIEVVGVFYRDSNDVEQEFDADDYSVDDASHPARIFLPSSGSWPTAIDGKNAVRIRFKAGYLDSSCPPVEAVPDDIRFAILLTLGSLYAHRETMIVGQTAVAMPWGAEQLLRMHRVELSMA